MTSKNNTYCNKLLTMNTGRQTSCAMLLRTLLLLVVLLVMGIGDVWGQTGTDYSGIFYFVNCGSGKDAEDKKMSNPSLSSDDYFYLVPADNPPQNNKRAAYYSVEDNNGNSEMPYLTTYRTKQDAADVPDGVTNRPHNSVWIVEFAGTDTETGIDYYYLIHASTGKYVVFEPPYSDKPNRKSVHLLATDSPSENAKFAITINSNYYNFRPKSVGTGADVNRYFNTSYKNYNIYYSNQNNADGNVNYHRGLVGLWSAAGDASDWKKETVTFTEVPTISEVSEITNKVTVTGPAWLPKGYKIRYTFSADGEPADPTATSEKMTNAEYSVTAAGTLKVVVERYGVLLSAVASKYIEPARCTTPVFTYSAETQKVSITMGTPNTRIYYTLDETDPTTSSTRIQYGEPFDMTDQQTVRAFATKSGFRDSEIASSKLVLNPTITLAEDEYTYSGSTIEPTVSSVMDGVTPIDVDEYMVSYADYTNAGVATVNILDNVGGDYIVYGSTTFTINPKVVGIDWTDIEFTYNGEMQVPTATVTGLVNNDEIGITVTGGQTNAGNYTATASALTGEKKANYLLPEANAQSFTISPKSIGDGTLTSDYTLDFGENNTILLMDDVIGRALVLSTDYSVGDDSDDSPKYSERRVTGQGNYTGYFDVRNVVISFTTDTDQEDWSATFAAEKADESDIGLALPEGVSAFIISEIQGEWAIPEPLNYIPAGVPVLLVAHKKINGFVATQTESGDVTPITDVQKTKNMLEEVTETTPGYDPVSESAPFATKQIYLLYKNEFVFNKAGNMKKGKVYLNPNHAAPSPEPAPSRLQIAWNYTTGIEDGKGKMDEGRSERWYTLDGRCLSGKPDAKGLYIVGGKKIVVK